MPLRQLLMRRRTPVEALILIIVLLVIAGVIALGRSMKVIQQYEKGVLYRFGQIGRAHV